MGGPPPVLKQVPQPLAEPLRAFVGTKGAIVLAISLLALLLAVYQVGHALMQVMTLQAQWTPALTQALRSAGLWLLFGTLLVALLGGAGLWAVGLLWTERQRAQQKGEQKTDELRRLQAQAQSAHEASERLLTVARNNEERFRLLLANTAQVTWITGPDGVVTEPQRSWTDFTGQPLNQMQRGAWLEVVHPEDREASAEAWRIAISTGEPYEIERRLRRADGQYRLMHVRAVGLRDSQGQVREWVGAERDITDQRQGEQEREKLIELLKRRNQELDQFAYVASHDLKAPLRGIANLSMWIQEDLGEAVNEQTREHLRLLYGRVQRMEALIDAILAYCRADRIKTGAEFVESAKLVADVVELLSPPEGTRVELLSPMPTVYVPKILLQQTLMNLIGNAIKHCRTAAPVIQVACRDMGEAWEFRVSDNGPGIHPRYHEKIFHIFQTLESRDRVEGTGIGLAIVKKIVESVGGSVRVDSEEGLGATFSVCWPKFVREMFSHDGPGH